MKAIEVVENLKQRFPGEPEYIQAVSQVLATIEDEYNKYPDFERANLIERLCIPDRIVQFRVTWTDDYGRVQTNMGYRVQHNNAIGPYKGGLRYHQSVNLGILKFLAFEQTFKNSLTTLPMGGAKGGSDFSPRGKSDAEVMRFCQAFMNELYRHIGPDEDVPAGDIGVGGREIGYLFGHYKKLTHQFQGVLTGKGAAFGGSLMRPEATGYGVVYFLQSMLQTRGIELKGKRVLISGSGNVAQYAAEKCIQMGAKVLTLSDSDGYIYDPDGISAEKLQYVMELKNFLRGRIREYASRYHSSGRGSKHAIHARSHRNLPASKNPLRARKGLQRRRSVGIRTRNDAELRATIMDGEGSRRLPQAHHERHTPELHQVRHRARRIHQLRQRSQRRRLHESGKSHDGTRHRLSHGLSRQTASTH